MQKLSSLEYGRQYNRKNIVYLTEYRKEYYKKNKEKISNKVCEWKKTNAQHTKEWFHKYYLKYREKFIKKAEQFATKNPHKRMQYSRKWREENKEYATLACKNWRNTNPFKVKQHNQLRRKRGGWIPIKIIQMVYENNIKKFGTLTCILCDKIIEFGQDSLEHLTPLSRGGSNSYENLGIAHKKCNSRKQTRTLEEWRKINAEVIS